MGPKFSGGREDGFTRPQDDEGFSCCTRNSREDTRMVKMQFKDGRMSRIKSPGIG